MLSCQAERERPPQWEALRRQPQKKPPAAKKKRYGHFAAYGHICLALRHAILKERKRHNAMAPCQRQSRIVGTPHHKRAPSPILTRCGQVRSQTFIRRQAPINIMASIMPANSSPSIFQCASFKKPTTNLLFFSLMPKDFLRCLKLPFTSFLFNPQG